MSTFSREVSVGTRKPSAISAWYLVLASSTLVLSSDVPVALVQVLERAGGVVNLLGVVREPSGEGGHEHRVLDGRHDEAPRLGQLLRVRVGGAVRLLVVEDSLVDLQGASGRE